MCVIVHTTGQIKYLVSCILYLGINPSVKSRFLLPLVLPLPFAPPPFPPFPPSHFPLPVAPSPSPPPPPFPAHPPCFPCQIDYWVIIITIMNEHVFITQPLQCWFSGAGLLRPTQRGGQDM